MKTRTEKLPGIIAFIESGNGFAKVKAKKELEKMVIRADKKQIFSDNFLKTKSAYKKRHKELHKALDELFADYISHHPTEITEIPLKKLLDWSFE